ncbi:MAG: hypothetical protein R6V58_00180 [Planctomycetota bacterium]
MVVAIAVGAAAGLWVWSRAPGRRKSDDKGTPRVQTPPPLQQDPAKRRPVAPPVILKQAARLTPRDIASPPHPRDIDEATLREWRDRMWAALYSIDPDVRAGAIENLYPFATIRMADRLIELADGAASDVRAQIAVGLAAAAHRAKDPATHPASQHAARDLKADVALAVEGVSSILAGMDTEALRKAKAWSCVYVGHSRAEELPAGTARRLQAQCLRCLDAAPPEQARSVAVAAHTLACYHPPCFDALLAYMLDRLRQNRAWPKRRILVDLLGGFTSNDKVRPVMQLAALDDDDDTQALAFRWLRAWADRHKPEGKNGVDYELEWIASRLKTASRADRAALICYIGKRWGAAQAYRLDASAIEFDLSQKEIKLLEAQKPNRLLLKTIREINRPAVRPR